MGKILEFKTRAERETPSAPLTPQETYLRLLNLTLDDLQKITARIKSVGPWDPANDATIMQIATALNAMAFAAVHGTKEQDNAPTVG